MQTCYKQRFGKDKPTLSFDSIYITERSASASRRQINLSVRIEYQCKIYLIFTLTIYEIQENFKKNINISCPRTTLDSFDSNSKISKLQ